MERIKSYKMKKVLAAAIVLLLLAGCNKKPDIPPADLGGGQIFDPSLTDPAAYRISVSQPNPTAAQAQVPVIIACHGYSASTFEWDEFRTWSAGRTDYYIDQVLLAGHGTTYAAFQKSTYVDWEESIIDEYSLLREEGYTNINFAASSTSCTLLLDLIKRGIFKNTTSTIHIFMVDPIVIPSDKFLPLIGVLGPVLGYVTANNAPGEEKYYYHYRPEETLKQLQDVLTVVRNELQEGITLPANIYLKVYKSIKDPTADPVSAVLIYDGVKTNDGNRIGVDLINSNLHVFTRLSLVPNVTALDRQNQIYAFTDITTKIFQ
jgi:carboxylesterase